MWRSTALLILLVVLAASTSAFESFYPSPLWGAFWFALLLVWVAYVCFVGAGPRVSRRLQQYLWRAAFICSGVLASFATFVIAGDYLHLLANYREYELAVAASPGSTQAFGWGSGGFVGSHQLSRRLVYSPAAAPQSDATAWQSEVGGPAPRWQVKHLFGHYYVVEAAEG